MNISYLFSLPLLTKELIEQAQHKRTYVLRVIYAVVLYGLALSQYALSMGGGRMAFANLGQGRVYFDQLVNVQYWAIMLILPAIGCGALTVEKEKDTLALLLLTKLSPWTIIFEKFLSRVFAMGTFQLLSLPLFGIVQSMGGVEVWEIIAAILRLMVMTIEVASVSILCSTWFRTTSEAFVMSYLSVLCLSGLFSAFALVVAAGAGFPWSAATQTEPLTATQEFFIAIGRRVLPVGMGIAGLLFSAFTLLIASRILVARAFIPTWNVVLVLFQRADRFFNALNARTTGGIVLVRDRDSLPLFQPIAWRETRKKSLGTFRYQFRVLMLLLAPLILVIAAVITDMRMEFNSPFRMFPVYFWFVSVICLTIHSTGVIPAERIRQTLDVLLVVPMTPKEIVVEKLSGVRRMIKVLSVPFVVLIVFHGIWTGYIHQATTHVRATGAWTELISASLSVFFYMPVIMWIGFEFGLRMRTQIQAVLFSFLTITGLCLAPLAVSRTLAVILEGSGYQPDSLFNLAIMALEFLSPLQPILGVHESTRRYDPMRRAYILEDVQSNAIYDPLTQSYVARSLELTVILLAMNFIFYGILWYFLRRNAIGVFSEKVRRLEPDGNPKSIAVNTLAPV